jgi:hypothetical protein
MWSSFPAGRGGAWSSIVSRVRRSRRSTRGDRLQVFYGASDTAIGVVELSRSALLSTLQEP